MYASLQRFVDNSDEAPVFVGTAIKSIRRRMVQNIQKQIAYNRSLETIL